MPQNATGDELVFSTKWFEIISRPGPDSEEPHYLINCSDFVCIVALNAEGKLLLVRQFRPAAGQAVLEVPSGHLEPGESPEVAARRELLEETGHAAEKLELLGSVSPGIGRFTNRMWTYFAGDARPTANTGSPGEAGVDLVIYEGAVRALLAQPDFCSSLSHTAIFAAVLKGKLTLDNRQSPCPQSA